MQPHIAPVDHESRHSLYHGEEEPRPTEHTPLLRAPRLEASQLAESMDYKATLTIILLLIVFLSGVAIGIYLLVAQNNSENVLPPVDTPLQFVSQSQWNSQAKRPALSMTAFKAREVAVVQTDTVPCHSVSACTHLLRELKTNQSGQLVYNFLVSSDGQTYEALGWQQPSDMFPQHPLALVLAFIGNFTDTPPTRAQLDEARNFFAVSVSLRHLDPAYLIIGKNTKVIPKYLFKSLGTFPHWSSELSDSF